MKKPIPFGKYLLLERINVGGMAEVFKAKVLSDVEGFERLVAVKRILPSIAEDQEFITMFKDEAKISAQLTHANIAQIFELGKVGDAHYIAMEFIHGKDLRAIFDRARKRGETVPVPMACYVMMKVCEGLDYAHNKKDAAGRDLNLVHRDVSPQNILISYDGDVKIIDFGVAKAAGKAGKTQAGILKGKFGYMSPEQVRGLPLDRRSDIFSVGIVLYELLTGERLFYGESDFSTLEKVRNVEIMPPSTYNRRIPEELEQIVLKALAKDVDDRYQTAMDLHDDLQSFTYTSGNFFARKDLSAYMRKAFADEIAKESAREEEYRRMEQSGQLRSGGSGLDQFADLEPIDSAHPSGHQPPARAAKVSALPTTASSHQKKTLLGMPAAVPPPPPPPPRHSMPGEVPPPPPPPPPRHTVPEPPPPVTASPRPVAQYASSGPALDMDWDEEELSTQIYDKPEAMQAALQAGLPSVQGEALAPAPGSGAPAAPIAQASRMPMAMAPAPAMPMMPVPTPAPAPAAAPAPAPAAVPALAPVAPRFPTAPVASPMGAPSPFEGLPAPAEGPEPTAVTRPKPSESAKSGGRRVAALVAGLAAMLGIVAVGAWLLLSPGRPATITITTIPPDPVVYLDGEVVQSSTASPFVVPGVPPGQHLVEVRKAGYEPWATTVTVLSGQDLALPPVTLVPTTASGPAIAAQSAGAGSAPASSGTGFALTTVPPGARVFVDDRELPQRTPVQVTDLAPGVYRIRVENGANYTPWLTQVTIAAGQVVELPPAVLALRSVSVEFTSEPSGARVTLVRGSEIRRIGETPTRADVDVTGGPWTVRMERSGYRDYEAVLTLPSGQPSALHAATLEPRTTVERSRGGGPRIAATSRGGRQESGGGATTSATASPSTSAQAGGGTGTLRINTRPWSQVFVDGRLIGNTPQMNIPLPAGRHTVTLVNSDFNIRHTITVEIRAGQTETRVLTLSPGG
jgi:serine/threonine protein kinase